MDPIITTRRRSASLVKLDTVGSKTAEVIQDQNVYSNLNADWVNSKGPNLLSLFCCHFAFSRFLIWSGAWLIHVVLLLMGKILIDSVPGMNQDLSWTLTNILYASITYLMFHHVQGIPFASSLHNGAYDDLTLWEQIDDGAQYTPAKKWLFCVPVGVFLLSTHYTNYNPWLFALNLTATIAVLIPKLPQVRPSSRFG